jgi:hypothetical protein
MSKHFESISMALKYANVPNLLPNKNLEMSKCSMNTSTNPCVGNSVGDPIPMLEARTGTEDETTLRGMQRNEKWYAEACAANEEFIKSKFQTPRIPPVINVPSLLLPSIRPITKPLQEQEIRAKNMTRQPDSLLCASATTPIGAIEPSSVVFVSNRVKDYLPPPILAPPCPTAVPTYFLASVRLIVASNERTPSVSPFRHDNSDPTVAEHNAEIIRQYLPHGLSKLFRSLQGTVAGAGAEFRKPSKLQALFRNHPHWPLLEDFLINGVHMLTKCDLSADPIRMAENFAMLDYGNHKTCENDQDAVRVQIDKDCHYGYSLPLPIDFHTEIPNAMIGAISLVKQMTTADNGERVPNTVLHMTKLFQSTKKPFQRTTLQQQITNLRMYLENLSHVLSIPSWLYATNIQRHQCSSARLIGNRHTAASR